MRVFLGGFLVMSFLAVASCSSPEGDVTHLTYYNYCAGKSLKDVIIIAGMSRNDDELLYLKTKSKLSRERVFVRGERLFVLGQVIVVTWAGDSVEIITVDESEVLNFMKTKKFSCPNTKYQQGGL